jgi:hypothetical protein
LCVNHSIYLFGTYTYFLTLDRVCGVSNSRSECPITDAPWPHNWIHVYCNHALLWVHADQADEGCHPGPESRAFMADLQMLATYPVYGIILNVIPYTYPAIVAFLVVVALPERFFTRGRTSALPDEPAKRPIVVGLGGSSGRVLREECSFFDLFTTF